MDNTKNYKRAPLLGVSQLLIGILFIVSVLMEKNWVPIYDGGKFLVGIFSLIYGIWYLVKPYISITQDQLIIFKSPFSSIAIQKADIVAVNIKKSTLLIVKANKETTEIPTKPLGSQEVKSLQATINKIAKENVG